MHSAAPDLIGTTIINVEEQMRGWLAAIAKERTLSRQITTYRALTCGLRMRDHFGPDGSSSHPEKEPTTDYHVKEGLMTCMFLLLGPCLVAAEPAQKSDETITFDRKGQTTVFGGDFRLKRTRAELLLDIDPNPPGTAGPMKARTRLILNPFTAKRLQAALRTTIERHEAVFGAVELPEAKQAKEDETLDPRVEEVYANFCRVTANPEEVFIDFGVNENPFGAGPKVITMERRVILTPLGSKMLLVAFNKALAAYESDFGVIELDVRKRVKKQTEP